MARQIRVNEPIRQYRQAYFDIRSTDGITPAINEAGGQPQLSINGISWTSAGIGQLINIGYGRYYAILDQGLLSNPGDVIETRYKSDNTVETPGDSFVVIETSAVYTPSIGEIIIESYGTVDEADFYFSTQLNSDTWEAATVGDKIKALRTATQQIDRLSFIGTKYNTNQLLQFPRYIDSTSINMVPSDIKIACFEIALRLLDGVDPEQEINNLYADSRTYAATRVGYERSYIPEHTRAGIISAVAWTYLRPYLSGSRNIRINRVS